MSSPTTAQESRARSSREQEGRVLVVTDNPLSIAFTRALEDAGLKVVGTSRSVGALIALRRERPHIIIVDEHLQGLTTKELSGQLLRAEESAVPFILVGQRTPTLDVRHAALEAGAFDYFQLPQELPLLVARSSQLVSVRHTIEHLRAEADRDYLTGLLNRRRFRTALGQEVERWRRYNTPCGLVIVDVDHLKRINDTHGHSAGDMVIRHVAGALSQMSRDNDTAARLGGEEFALLLAGADADKAVQAAERLRQTVAAEALEAIGRVTISLGVASCPAHATSERELYAASDAALYAAKRGGRDRVHVAPLISL
ncbi:MAG TPA: diguanylate cyclase [Pyrinomonadaceae bacterium]|nr:diguanylate cyclase [Pyrinomonadaceae bacterium]